MQDVSVTGADAQKILGEAKKTNPQFTTKDHNVKILRMEDSEGSKGIQGLG